MQQILKLTPKQSPENLEAFTMYSDWEHKVFYVTIIGLTHDSVNAFNTYTINLVDLEVDDLNSLCIIQDLKNNSFSLFFYLVW